MLYMQRWIRGWMNAGKKEGRKNYTSDMGSFLVSLCFGFSSTFPIFRLRSCSHLLGTFSETYAVFVLMPYP